MSVERTNEPSVKIIRKNGGVYVRSFEFENETADVYVIILVASNNGDITGMVNGWMVKDGYATVLTIEPNTKYAEQFEFYQKTAKDAGRGLWEYEEFAKDH